MRPRHKAPPAFPVRWRGYDRDAVDQYFGQVANANDRLHARLAFLEELIGSWQEQGIELPKPPASTGRDFRFDPRAALPRDHGLDRFEPPLHVDYPPPKRLTGRARPLLLGQDGPEARAQARKRKLVLALGLVLALVAMMFSRRISHSTALTSSASPHVIAEPATPPIQGHDRLDRAAADVRDGEQRGAARA